MSDSDALTFLTPALMGWFRPLARRMPWRSTKDPYAIWVSEILLQQTREQAAAEHYRRFLARFPDVRSLAGAGLGDVLKAWEGMGYYARARNLHRAAGIICRDFSGEIPSTAADLASLPGVGKYTAGAVASIAFSRDEPVVDGNVTRVLCRVFAIRRKPTAAPVQRRLWSLARTLLPASKAGRFNQALMDLGATVCLPRRPRCDACPLNGCCKAFSLSLQERLPVKAAKKVLPHHTIVAGVVYKAGRILIDRRPRDGLLGGLWEFPGGKVHPGETLPAALRREIAEELGVSVDVGEELVTVRHAYSHFRITMHVFRCRYLTGRCKAIACDAFRWVLPRQLDRYAFPKANHAILDELKRKGDTC